MSGKKNRASEPVSHERLLQVLDYDPATGLFHWKERLNFHMKVGAVAGTPSTGYTCIYIDGRRYPAGRLAFFYCNKRWPVGVIDHINLDRSDDRIANLREASISQNNANAKPRCTNTSGYKGAFFHKQVGKFRAQIKSRGRAIHLGMFDTAAEAGAAYARAAEREFGEFARVK